MILLSASLVFGACGAMLFLLSHVLNFLIVIVVASFAVVAFCLLLSEHGLFALGIWAVTIGSLQVGYFAALSIATIQTSRRRSIERARRAEAIDQSATRDDVLDEGAYWTARPPQDAAAGRGGGHLSKRTQV